VAASEASSAIGARSRRAWLAPALSVVFTIGMLSAVLAVRWHAHYSNVDDYFYALQTRAYVDALGLNPLPLVHAWQAYGSSTPLIPMLALPIAAIDTSPDVLVLIQAIPLLVLLFSIRSLLGSLGLRPASAWLAAALITTLPPVLGYAAMYQYGLAATACMAVAGAAYARSNRLRTRAPTLLLGVAVGLLAVSRVVAPVYVAALLGAIAIDVLADRGDGSSARMRNAGLAAVITLAIAAPWWLTTGSSAVHYLTSAGYGVGLPGERSSHLDAVVHRFTWTATESGWLLSAVVGALLVWAVGCMRRRAPGWRLAAWLVGVAALGMVLLATSSDRGTAFALPCFVLACCVAAWGIEGIAPRTRVVVLAATVLSLVVPGLALMDLVGPARLGGQELWQVGTPGLGQARSALGCHCAPPDSNALAAQVVRIVGERPMLIVRDDALLNPQSLRYESTRQGLTANFSTPPADGVVTRSELSKVRYVLAGATPGPYLNVNLVEFLRELHNFRFRPVLNLELSATNSVLLLAIGPAHRALDQPSKAKRKGRAPNPPQT